jgi:hypothetical protein
MINYLSIAEAIQIYSGLGYKYVDAPWFVSRDSMLVTAPAGRRFCSSFIGDLVASGEQSFIEMHKQGNLPKGRYVCATPCFRDESVVNKIHQNYFFKVELIDVMPENSGKSLQMMMEDALNFFRFSLPEVALQDGDDYGITDIYAEGLELGSYGIRQHDDFIWVYGTGIAEPRFSQAIERKALKVLEKLLEQKRKEVV